MGFEEKNELINAMSKVCSDSRYEDYKNVLFSRYYFAIRKENVEGSLGKKTI